MGCLVCLVPLFNADLAAFIGTRLAFCVVAALLAMACSYDIKPTLGYQGQLTVIDHISVLLTLVAAIVAAESMVAYSWWSSFRCDPFKKGSGWYAPCVCARVRAQAEIGVERLEKVVPRMCRGEQSEDLKLASAGSQ